MANAMSDYNTIDILCLCSNHALAEQHPTCYFLCIYAKTWESTKKTPELSYNEQRPLIRVRFSSKIKLSLKNTASFASLVFAALPL